MTRKALIIGVDKYQSVGDLRGCVNDANSMNEVLSWNHDGSPNFSTKMMLNDDVTSVNLHREIESIFSREAETVVIYFAGHGVFDSTADFGFLVTTDGKKHAWGLALETLLGFANSANPKITNTIIILDCCYSGRLGDPGERQGGAAKIGKGVTLMTACNDNEVAMEFGGEGLFTSTIVNGLEGEAADIEGNITPAMLYSHVDRSLGDFDQRPLYKTNVQAFNVLRKTEAKALAIDLRRLPGLFKDAELVESDGKRTEVYRLGPWCEPQKDRGEYQERYKDIEFDKDAHEKYRLLQKLVRAGLVLPYKQPHMWHAAMEQTGCYLTGIGQHYRKLAEKGRFGR